MHTIPSFEPDDGTFEDFHVDLLGSPVGYCGDQRGLDLKHTVATGPDDVDHSLVNKRLLGPYYKITPELLVE